jgi:hypothetical protein
MPGKRYLSRPNAAKAAPVYALEHGIISLLGSKTEICHISALPSKVRDMEVLRQVRDFEIALQDYR